jgi:hypothetical protein
MAKRTRNAEHLLRQPNKLGNQQALNKDHAPKRLPSMEWQYPGAINKRLIPVEKSWRGVVNKDMGIAIEQWIAIPERWPNKKSPPEQNR